MARRINTAKLIQSVLKLREQREAAARLVAELDALLVEIGITPEVLAKVMPPKRGSSRGHYPQTADEFILGLVKGKKLTTAEINAAWKQAGRGGTADVPLLRLVKGGKIKRRKIRGKRGSRYWA